MDVYRKKDGLKGWLTTDCEDGDILIYSTGVEHKLLNRYNSLSKLFEDWEDYEEPKEFWFINDCGDVLKYKYDGGCSCPILGAKGIGNYFKTKEEAEKAVERLKALKRLKDNGFEFENWKTWEKATGYSCPDRNVAHSYYAAFTFRSSDRLEKDEQVKADLDLLFGEGEEC